jgi:hypothetical protein
MTKANPSIQIRSTKPKPLLTMITPGRRAYGEEWSKVTVTPNPDTGGYDVEREDTPAPAGNTPIIVPALGEMSIEMADYLLEYKRKDQEYRVSQGLPIRTTWTHEEINNIWHDWCEFKAKTLAGKTQSGPGGWAQRERVARRNNVRR